MQPPYKPYKRKYESYFTRSEIARIFEVAPNTVNRWVRGGKLPSVVSPGGRRRYPVDEILKLIPVPARADRTASPESGTSGVRETRRVRGRGA